jgi:hypothetical protein
MASVGIVPVPSSVILSRKYAWMEKSFFCLVSNFSSDKDDIERLLEMRIYD